MEPDWSGVRMEPMEYEACRARLTQLLAELGIDNPSIYTPHSPRHFYPTCAIQRGWGREDRNRVGRWSIRSTMSDHYDSSQCATEARLRNDIVRGVREQNWYPVGPQQLPRSQLQDATVLKPSNIDENDPIAPTMTTHCASLIVSTPALGPGPVPKAKRRRTVVPLGTTNTVPSLPPVPTSSRRKPPVPPFMVADSTSETSTAPRQPHANPASTPESTPVPLPTVTQKPAEHEDLVYAETPQRPLPPGATLPATPPDPILSTPSPDPPVCHAPEDSASVE